MALQVVQYSIIVLFERLRGFAYLGRVPDDSFGPEVWYDKNLLRAGGAADQESALGTLESLRRIGLEMTEVVDGNEVWKDACVVHEETGPVLHACSWLEFDPATKSVWTAGDAGKLIVRNEVGTVDGGSGALIQGSVESSHAPQAGHVFVDAEPQAVNFDKYGRYELFVPSSKVAELAAAGGEHSITIENYRTGNTASLELELKDNHKITMPTVLE